MNFPLRPHLLALLRQSRTSALGIAERPDLDEYSRRQSQASAAALQQQISKVESWGDHTVSELIARKVIQSWPPKKPT